MTPEGQRVAIAELFGYRFVDEGWRYPELPDWQQFKAVYQGDGFIGLCRPGWMQIPHYTTDLNEAIRLIVFLGREDCLCEICSGVNIEWSVTVIRKFQTDPVCVEFGSHLAETICRAFLKTLSLWDDSK